MFNKLYDLRNDKNITQNNLANILKVDRSIISKWEKCKTIIPLKHLNNVANFFNTSIDYILNLSDDKNSYSSNIKVLNKKTIGNKIKKLRQINNITLRDIAKELNTSSSTISAYETGKVLLSTKNAYLIATKYNISIDWLCGRN